MPEPASPAVEMEMAVAEAERVGVLGNTVADEKSEPLTASR